MEKPVPLFENGTGFCHIWDRIHRISPYTTLEEIPKTSTGPAMVNILAPTPRINPSVAVNIGHRLMVNC